MNYSYELYKMNRGEPDNGSEKVHYAPDDHKSDPRYVSVEEEQKKWDNEFETLEAMRSTEKAERDRRAKDEAPEKARLAAIHYEAFKKEQAEAEANALAQREQAKKEAAEKAKEKRKRKHEAEEADRERGRPKKRGRKAKSRGRS